MHEIFVNGHNISQLICYSTTYAQYSDFLDRAQLLTQKLLKQDYVSPSHRYKNSTVVIIIWLTITKSTSQMTEDVFLFT